MKLTNRSLAITAITLALCTIPLAAHAAPSSIYVNNVSGTSTAPSCTAATYSTIQSAVMAATDGDTIVVCPSMYAETVTDQGKSLTFQGPQQGISAVRRTGPEAVVDGAGGIAFTLSGTGSTVDGFTLTGATSGMQTPAIFVTGTAESASYNVFTGDAQAATVIASDATFTHNLVQNPIGTNAGGFFFNNDQGANSRVAFNRFGGDLENGAVNVADPSTAISGLSITNNSFNAHTGGNFAVLGGTRGVVISHNTVRGDADSGTAMLLLGDNAGYSITKNRVTGIDASAVAITGGYGYPSNGSGDVSENAFKHNRRGINVTDASGTITVHLNILVGNTLGGTPDSPNAAIRNVTNAAVSAANNYYGCNGGPGAKGCDEVLGNVNAYPFLLLTTRVAHASIPMGGSTRFIADLNHNSAGDLVSGHVLNRVEQASFTFTGGTVNPATAAIVRGAARTTLTATAPSGTYVATATVENSTSSKSVAVGGGATSGTPRIRIGDAVTNEGDSGVHAIRFSVRLSRTSTRVVSVRYITVRGAARPGLDYVAKRGRVYIPAGKQLGHVSVRVKGDTVREANESFYVAITRPRNGRISDPSGTAVIRNDDR